MPILSSEIYFRKGLVALAGGDPAEATNHFKQAILIERQRCAARPQMRYVSYFGLASALAEGTSPEAIHACERAARVDFYNPDLQLNLGRVYLMAGKTTRALVAFERGLRLAPAHGPLRDALGKVDRRSAPVLRCMGRNHPLNRWLGKLRYAVASHRYVTRLTPRRTVTPS